jgi:hypothetical protein
MLILFVKWFPTLLLLPFSASCPSDLSIPSQKRRKSEGRRPPPGTQLNKKLYTGGATKFLSQQAKLDNLNPEVKKIYQREVKAYEQADVVLTITADDKEKMLMTVDQEFELLLKLAFNGTVRPSVPLSL